MHSEVHRGLTFSTFYSPPKEDRFKYNHKVIQRAFPRIALIGYQTIIAFILPFFRNVVSESNQTDSSKNAQDDPNHKITGTRSGPTIRSFSKLLKLIIWTKEEDEKYYDKEGSVRVLTDSFCGN